MYKKTAEVRADHYVPFSLPPLGAKSALCFVSHHFRVLLKLPNPNVL